MKQIRKTFGLKLWFWTAMISAIKQNKEVSFFLCSYPAISRAKNIRQQKSMMLEHTIGNVMRLEIS